MNIAIIPARGGSKRIPRKNIKLFHGKPMIAYSIEAAKESGCFDKIIVSTDDQEIAEIAQKFGAEVPFLRDPALSDDFTGTNAVVADTIKKLNMDICFVCCIYATAPFLKVSSIRAGYKLIANNHNSDFAVTVTNYSFPVQRSCILNNDGDLCLREQEHRMTRSQDLEDVYHDAGQIYWGCPSAFLDDKPLFSNNTKPIKLSNYLVQDIDTPDDWRRAEVMYPLLMKEGLI